MLNKSIDFLMVMDKFIKCVPLITIVCLITLVLQSGDGEFTNEVAAALCAVVVFMFTSLLYIVSVSFKHKIKSPVRYFFVMLIAGILAYAILYLSLEYFYT